MSQKFDDANPACRIWFAEEQEPPAVGSNEGEAGQSRPPPPPPPPPVFRVERFAVHEAMCSLFEVKVLAAAGPHVRFRQLLGKGAAFSVRRDANFTTPVRVWTGICTAIEQRRVVGEGTGAEEDKSLYELTIRPDFWRLTLRKNNRTFQHCSRLDIVLQILREWGIVLKRGLEIRHLPSDEASLDRILPKLEYRTQYEETDYDFVARLLAEAGLSFYFDYHDFAKDDGSDAADPNAAPDAGKKMGTEVTQLVIDYLPGQNQPRPKPLTYLDNMRQEWGATTEIASNIQIGDELRPGRVAISGHDFRLNPNDRKLGWGEVAGPDFADEMLIEQFSYRPNHFIAEDEKKRQLKVADGRGAAVYNKDVSEARALLELERLRTSRQRISFDSNALELRPGVVVAIGSPTGEHPHPDLPHDRPTLVLESTFAGLAPKGSAASTWNAGWHVHCDAIHADVPFRAPVPTKPRVYGIQSAIVVGPPGEEIHCDEFGRVRIQFHWDRDHQSGAPLTRAPGKGEQNAPNRKNNLLDDMGSCWVRVATQWAGSSYGFISIPRIGHEVLVQFFEGDPDQPVIIGSVYNSSGRGDGAAAPPYPLPQHANRSVWKSDSTKGSGGYNEIYLDDSKGGEMVHLRAQKNYTEQVNNAQSSTVGGSRSATIGSTDKVDVGKMFVVTVGDSNGILISAENKTINLQVAGEQGSSITLAGGNIYLNAYDELHLHANGKIDISSVRASVNIDGVKVNVNCGEAHQAAPSHPLAQAAGPSLPGTSTPGFRPQGGERMTEAPGPLAQDVTVDPSKTGGLAPEIPATPPMGPMGSPDSDFDPEGLDRLQERAAAPIAPAGLAGPGGVLGGAAARMASVAIAPLKRAKDALDLAKDLPGMAPLAIPTAAAALVNQGQQVKALLADPKTAIKNMAVAAGVKAVAEEAGLDANGNALLGTAVAIIGKKPPIG